MEVSSDNGHDSEETPLLHSRHSQIRTVIPKIRAVILSDTLQSRHSERSEESLYFANTGTPA
jgi:hypothetical protein